MTLAKYHKQAPRYTSYPTAPSWYSISPSLYEEHLGKIGEKPLSLYFHIPFCKSMCLFCGCSVILNRNPSKESEYVDYLFKEIDLVVAHLKGKKRVSQLHFGGGTPTKLSAELLTNLMEKIKVSFILDEECEIAIEVDPRTVFEDEGEKLKLLKELGFNRVSFGVQDTDREVQIAIRRFQSYEMTRRTFELAKSLGFRGINIDLIYGLPVQTRISFAKTVVDILEMRPDRIALFSYAKIPWLKLHQRAIDEETLPSTEEKFEIYETTRKAFIDAGYVAIGMDHFALPDDELALSYREKTLQRNFQGYTVKRADDHLGFGVTAIGFTQHLYVQNCKELKDYYAALDNSLFPSFRGCFLTQEDRIRKWVIHTLMCHFALDKKLFFETFTIDFDTHFKSIANPLTELEKEGLIKNGPIIHVTPLGELFIRNVAMVFDAYLPHQQQKFSYSV